ncbi:MAG: hypothetical protein ACRDOI_11690 [Trebonia sp.]
MAGADRPRGRLASGKNQASGKDQGSGMHGEYKPPGGKLVAADVEVASGLLSRVQISGDFFLEPDEALDRVNAALTGMPTAAGIPAITARVEDALGEAVTLAGVTAGSMAVAVLRAVNCVPPVTWRGRSSAAASGPPGCRDRAPVTTEL